MLPILLQKPVLTVTHCDGNTVAGQLKTQQNITEQSSIQKKSMMSVRSSVSQITAQDPWPNTQQTFHKITLTSLMEGCFILH
jgi:hypothetical protein